MKEAVLGVKLCGSCDPDIPTMEIALQIATGLRCRLVPYHEGTLRMTISGCRVACMEKDYPAHVTIRGLSVDGTPCQNETELIDIAIRRLRQYQEIDYKREE